jgi:hypothetical protein
MQCTGKILALHLAILVVVSSQSQRLNLNRRKLPPEAFYRLDADSYTALHIRLENSSESDLESGESTR